MWRLENFRGRRIDVTRSTGPRSLFDGGGGCTVDEPEFIEVNPSKEYLQTTQPQVRLDI